MLLQHNVPRVLGDDHLDSHEQTCLPQQVREDITPRKLLTRIMGGGGDVRLSILQYSHINMSFFQTRAGHVLPAETGEQADGEGSSGK